MENLQIKYSFSGIIFFENIKKKCFRFIIIFFFFYRFGLFLLAIYAGYNVIWNVTAALHTPLMAVTNAISGVIVVACMVTISQPVRPEDGSFNFTGFSFLATVGVFFATINIFGGFFVT